MGRRVYIDVEVYLDDFEDADLIDELESRGVISLTDAEALKKRGGVPATIDGFEAAWEEILRRRRHEALILIERALGTKWIGRLTG